MYRTRLKIRFWIQVISSVAANFYLSGFKSGTIFTGASKHFCVPFLNCYSCPGSFFSCPIGAMQVGVTRNGTDANASLLAKLLNLLKSFPFLVVGFLAFVAGIFGRAACGWLCPFGLFQRLLNKIPSKKYKGPEFFKYFKYVVLLVFVILLPALWVDQYGFGGPYFCKFICPQGTLEGGISLAILQPQLREQLGKLFLWKLFLLIAVIIASIFFKRPFCRWACPLGAFYGLFNKVSLLQLHFDPDKCIECGLCSKVCPVNLDVPRQINSAECLKCFDCKKVCPKNAIT